MGTFTSSTSDTTKITLGFNPKTLIVFGAHASGGSQLFVHRYENGSCYRHTGASVSNVSLPSTGINTIASIDSDGFTFNKTSNAGTLYYYAIN